MSGNSEHALAMTASLYIYTKVKDLSDHQYLDLVQCFYTVTSACFQHHYLYIEHGQLFLSISQCTGN
jgi:hypothetical protein